MGANLHQIVYFLKIAHSRYKSALKEAQEAKEKCESEEGKAQIQSDIDIKCDSLIELNPFKCQKELNSRKQKDQKKEEVNQAHKVLD